MRDHEATEQPTTSDKPEKGLPESLAALLRATLLVASSASLMSLCLRTLVSIFYVLSVPLMLLGDEGKAPPANPQLLAADQLYRAGKFAEAETSYRALLKTDSRLMPAQAGLVRALLRQQKIDEALETVNAAWEAQPNSAALLVAKGDVLEIKLDYRDALVNFEYNPKRSPRF